jgi:mono/diheme cytochrome c family protein
MTMSRLIPALTATLLAGPALAQDPGEGARLFEVHCAACHGAAATGDGPRAPVLNPQPTDLTALASSNGGDFPVLRVARRIDGRDPLVSHGSPMPVFGPFFEGDRSVALKTESGQPVMLSPPVADLVAWLISVQE